MLKVRIIPTLLWKNFGLVKGVGFDSWRRVGSVLPAIKVYNQREVDELILVDVVAHEGSEPLDIEAVKEFSEECFVPLTVGGGIRRVSQVSALLRSGADKVAVNTAVFERPELISELASRFGSQCVVASIDVSEITPRKWSCFSHAGRFNTDTDPVSWAQHVESLGAGEILLTSIDRDGTMQGYDLDLISAVTSAVKIPVIASGGAGHYAHMVEAVTCAGAAAVAAASMFHFTEQTPAEAKEFMSRAGIPVRARFFD